MWRARWSILTGAAIVAAGVLAWRLSVPDQYRATSQARIVVLADGRTSLDDDQLTLASRIYAELAGSRPVLRQAVDQSDTGYDIDASNWSIDVERTSPPGFLEIEGSARTGADAVALADAMAETLVETINSDPLAALPGELGSSTLLSEVVEPAELPKQRSSPRPYREAGVAFALSTIVLAELAALLRALSGRLPLTRTAEKLEQMVGVTAVELDGGIQDQTKLALFAGRRLTGFKIVTVVQCGGWPNPAAAIRLAEAMAGRGLRVLITDGDPYRPTLDTHLSIPRSPGMVDVLKGRAPLMEVVHRLDDHGSLNALTVGASHQAAWNTAEYTRVLASASAAMRFDIIIVSLSSASMPNGVASVLEIDLDTALVLSIDPEATSRSQLNELLHAFGGQSKITGLVLLTGKRASTEMGRLSRRWSRATSTAPEVPEAEAG